MAKSRQVQELTPAAVRALNRIATDAKRDKREVASTILEKFERWGDMVVGLTLGTVPPSLMASDEFWAHAERDLIMRLRRCRQKYFAGEA
jgi:hypothetical protein